MSLWDDLDKEDAERARLTRIEIEAEQAAWRGLTPEQQLAEIARMEAKYPDLDPEERIEDEDDEEDDDADDDVS